MASTPDAPRPWRPYVPYLAAPPDPLTALPAGRRVVARRYCMVSGDRRSDEDGFTGQTVKAGRSLAVIWDDSNTRDMVGRYPDDHGYYPLPSRGPGWYCYPTSDPPTHPKPKGWCP